MTTTHDMKHLHAALRAHGITTDDAVYAYLSNLLDTDVTSRKDLTPTDMATAIADLAETPRTPTEEQWAELTAPFPPEHIERLPKQVRRDDPEKGRCDGPRFSADGHHCGGWHARSVHLDYVGHAGITTRLNDVLGPGGWAFDPYAVTHEGIPWMTGNLFPARLTIGGVSKWDVAASFSSPQEAYGDALRRCAMRFGIGTYLWSKSEAARALAEATEPPPEPYTGPSTAAILADLTVIAGEQGTDLAGITAKFRETHGGMDVEALDRVPAPILNALLVQIRDYVAANGA